MKIPPCVSLALISAGTEKVGFGGRVEKPGTWASDVAMGLIRVQNALEALEANQRVKVFGKRFVGKITPQTVLI